MREVKVLTEKKNKKVKLLREQLNMFLADVYVRSIILKMEKQKTIFMRNPILQLTIMLELFTVENNVGLGNLRIVHDFRKDEVNVLFKDIFQMQGYIFRTLVREIKQYYIEMG